MFTSAPEHDDHTPYPGSGELIADAPDADFGSGFRLDKTMERGDDLASLSVAGHVETHRARMVWWASRERHVREATALINNGSEDLKESMKKLLKKLKEITNCSAVGIRLKDSTGFPYFVSEGFSSTFLEKENSACGEKKASTEAGETPRHAAGMCGNVVLGIADSKAPWATRGGSFWTSDSFALDSSRLSYSCRFRGTCITEGFRSIAVIPIRTPDGAILGTLQANDKKPYKFDPDTIELLEVIAESVAIRVMPHYRTDGTPRSSTPLAPKAAASEISCSGYKVASSPASDIEDLGKLLDTLELGHYARRFKEHGISNAKVLKFATLPDLTGTLSMSVASAIRLLLVGESRAIQEFTLTNVWAKRKIGEGSFGSVFEGTWGEVPVALKTVKKNQHVQASHLITEMILHSRLCHPNIIRFYGVSTIEGVSFMVHELAAGNVLSLLRSGAIGPRDPALFEFARGTAAGMCYLGSLGIVHCDLAARNVLYCIESGGFVAKITDFGLATVGRRRTSQDEYLPVRWSAPEVLTLRVCTKASDVWSFGVLLWELWTLGKEPYEGIKSVDILQYIKAGHRLTRPADCPDTIDSIMKMCWCEKADQRPRFDRILDILASIFPGSAGPSGSPPST